MAETDTLSFPFAVGRQGRMGASGGDDAIRARVIQVLCTGQGERVGLPSFGCGLLTLVFQTNDPVLAAATEFTVGQALTRWMGDEIVVDRVHVDSDGETMTVEVSYMKKADLSREAVRVHLG